jgi:hypothetical protein
MVTHRQQWNTLFTPEMNVELTARAGGFWGSLAPLFPEPVGVPHEKMEELARITWERFEAPRRAHGLTDVLPLGPTLAITEPRGYEGLKHAWVVYPAAQEPNVQARHFIMPPEVRQRLSQIRDIGLDPDLAILHQLPKGTLQTYGVQGVPPAFLNPPPPPKAVAQLQRFEQLVTAPATYSTRDFVAAGVAVGAVAAGAAVVATGGIVVVAGMALMGLASALSGLDPAILGVVKTSPIPGPGDPVFLYLLSAWRWEEEGYHVSTTVTERSALPER